MLSGVHTASIKHGDLLLYLLLHLMLGINYYVCPDSEHQVPHMWRLVTRGWRLVTIVQLLVTALGTAQIAVHIASIEHRRLVTRK